jgi:hypothetical protein
LSPQQAIKYYKAAIEAADEAGMDPFSDEIIGVKIQVAALMEKVGAYGKAIDVLEIVRTDCLKWIDMFGSQEGNQRKRTRLLGKTVGIAVKLGELYGLEGGEGSHEHAEEKLVWATETVLKEKKRRETEGVREDEGDWMNDEEIGGALECKFSFLSLSLCHFRAA